MIQLTDAMAGLAQLRPIFHSEADFKHALAWLIQGIYPNAQVRLEYRPRPDRRSYADIFVRLEGRTLAIELKYNTKTLSVVRDGEAFELQNQGAHPITRYKYIVDIERIENLVASGAAAEGWAIFLTNDPLFWKPSSCATNIDNAFLIHEAARVTGQLYWREDASTGKRKSVARPVHIAAEYVVSWHEYSSIHEPGAGRFRYTAVTVFEKSEG